MSFSTTLTLPSAHCGKNSRADLARRSAIVLAAALLANCGTGFGHHTLDRHTFEVSYGGEQDLCALLYSAELTLAAGYSYFYATDAVEPVDTLTYTPGPDFYMGSEGPVSCVGMPGCGGAPTLSTSWSRYKIHLLEEEQSPGEEIMLARRHGLRYEELFVYDAAFVQQALRGDDSIECSVETPSPY